MVDLIDPSLFGIVPTVENPKKTQFRPWHRPRKQWVRIKQWQYWTNVLLKTKAYADVDELHYFGFPGEDCLDIHVLGQDLPKGKKICFYALESSTNCASQINDIIHSKLMDFRYISPHSRVENSNFEILNETKSKLVNELRSRPAFHLINLDFMKALFPPQNGEKLLSAIIKLLTLQFERQNFTWLLFLTFRCDKKSLDTELLKKYMDVLYQNYADIDFRENLNSKIYQIKNETILENDELLQEDVFEEIVGISILKWILKNSVEKGIHMKTKSVGIYKIGEKQKDEDEEGHLFSIVLEFKKDNSFVKDATDLLPTYNPVAEEEVSCGIKIIDKISKASNIDDILEKNIELYRTLKQSTLDLLKEAGYDIKLYPY